MVEKNSRCMVFVEMVLRECAEFLLTVSRSINNILGKTANLSRKVVH